MTANISIDEDRNILDEDFVKFVAETNIDKGIYNIYANQGNKIAMCPLDGKEEVIIRNHKGIFKSPIGNLGQKGKEVYEVLFGGEFIRGKFIKIPYRDFVEITLSNGHKIVTTDNHLNLTRRGTVISKNLKIGDLLPFNLKSYKGFGGSYDLGYLVGVYCGDGSKTNGTTSFSLNRTTKAKVLNKIKSFCEQELGAVMTLDERESIVVLNTRSQVVASIIESFTTGDNALNKGLNSTVLGKSLEFRKGILDGYMDTDGGNKGRIYTSSEIMVRDLTALVASLGGVTNIKIKDDREGRLGSNTNYCVKIYNTEELRRRSYKGVWERDAENLDRVWFYITEISNIKKPYNTNAYCFEVETDEHLFQLANGLITHNCRFINDTERMEFRADSFGNGGLNIGSARVVTINFPRIAQEARDKDHFFSILDERVKLVRDLLIVHREEILKRRVEAGFLKFFKPLNWFTLDMLFSTIGINGLYEMCYFAGLPMESEEGQQFVEEVLLKLEDYAIAFSRESGHSFNTEEIPGESTAVVFAKKDRVANLVVQPFELYSNQYLPLIADVDPIERVKLSGRFMNIVSGGGIMHLNLQEQLDNPAKMKKLIKLALREGVPHMAINYGFGECENGHVTVCGNAPKCPICSAPIKDYMTRIIGYFTKTSSWNEVRRDYEYPRRKFK